MTNTVLVVDDSASIRELVAGVLSNAGYDVETAEDGAQALEAAGPHVRMVVTDLNMPRLDGVGLIRALRERRDLAGLPIVMLTTENQDEKKALGREAGATGWIVKPFDEDKLVAVVKKLIG